MMTEQYIRDALLEEDGVSGEILKEEDNGIWFFDYDTSISPDAMFFRFPDTCTKDTLKSLIFSAASAVGIGVTPEWCADILFDAYGPELADMMCTLKGIAVFDGDAEFRSCIEHFRLDGESVDEMLEEFNMSGKGFCGQVWSRRQIAFIDLGIITRTAKELAADGFSSVKEEILDGIGTTLIHEVRHIMLDNFILPEDDYPLELGSEEEVENFCREQWDRIRGTYNFG